MERRLRKSKVWCRYYGSKSELVVEKSNIVGQTKVLWGGRGSRRMKEGNEGRKIDGR